MINLFAGLETFLYVISSLLFYPVIAGLVLLVFWIVAYFGSFLREYFERRNGHFSALAAYKRWLENFNYYGDPVLAEVELERALQRAELKLIKSLDRIRFAIRVGPALGLMGTLIPMGIALSALAQGDMPKMASNMVTAFTTTVVGLACGIAAYLMSMVKERWIRADMREMEYLTEIKLRQLKLLEVKKEHEEVEDEISEKDYTI